MRKNSKEDIPEITEKTYVYEGFFDLRIDEIQKEGGISAKYTILLTKASAVAVLTKDSFNRYLIIREYRYPVQKWIYSLPGGRVEKQEPKRQAAERELLEETGYMAKNLQSLFTHTPMPSVSDQEVAVFFSEECEKIQEPSLDPLEIIEPVLLKEKELMHLVQKKSPFVDSLLSSALFYLLVSRKAC